MENQLGLPSNIPSFRFLTLKEADKVTIQTSKDGNWLDVMAHRDGDMVYIGTLENSKRREEAIQALIISARKLLDNVIQGEISQNLPRNPAAFAGVKELCEALALITIK